MTIPIAVQLAWNPSAQCVLSRHLKTMPLLLIIHGFTSKKVKWVSRMKQDQLPTIARTISPGFVPPIQVKNPSAFIQKSPTPLYLTGHSPFSVPLQIHEDWFRVSPTHEFARSDKIPSPLAEIAQPAQVYHHYFTILFHSNGSINRTEQIVEHIKLIDWIHCLTWCYLCCYSFGLEEVEDR